MPVRAHPFTVSPPRLLFSDRGFIEAFVWSPQQGTELVLFERSTGRSRRHEAEAMFVFHVAHAFEQGDETVVDVVAYDDPSAIAELRVARILDGSFGFRTRLIRLRMRRGVSRAVVEPLSDVSFEFPTVNHRWVFGRAQRVVWGASIAQREGGLESAIVRVELLGGSVVRHAEAGFVFGEPVFVGRPGGDDEEDGVILAVGSSLSRDVAVMCVRDPRTLEEIARGEVDVAIPLGFHGGFFRD